MAGYQELARQATNAAKFRGHDMGSWQWTRRSSGRVLGHATCATCGKGAYIDTRPEPNGIDIAGEAVALGCRESEAA